MKHTLRSALLLSLFTLHASLFLAAKPGHKFPELTPQETSAIQAATPEDARAKPQQPRKLLVFYRTEGFVHASIPNANHALAEMGKLTGAYTVTLSDDMAMFDPATLNTYDAVLFNNTTQLKFENPAHRQALLDFVANGKGLVGIHAGSDNFPTWPEGQALIGGVFHSHPWVSKDTVAVKNDDPGHILNTAFDKRGFWVKEEIYQIIGSYSREKQRVLLSLDMSRPENARPAAKIVRTDNDFPISWLKTEGKGRVFYTSLGHNKDIFEVPQILQHLLDGIQYALGDLAADAIPSAKLPAQPTPALAPDDKTPINGARPFAPALAAIVAYEIGNPLAPQIAVEDYLRAATPAQRAAAETELIALIQAPKTTQAAQNVFLNWLGWIGTEKSIPALSTAAANPALAHAATRALAAINAPEATAALITVITGNHAESTRIEALNALGQRRSDDAVPALAKLADDKTPVIAEAALEALGNIGTPAAIEALRALPLGGDQELQRARALIAAMDKTLRAAAPEKIDTTRAQAIQLYAATLRTAQNTQAHIETAQSLVALDPTNPALFIFPIDCDPRLRNVVAIGMATSGNADAIKTLTDNLEIIPAETQQVMMNALGSKPTPAALPLINLALASNDKNLCIAAITAAGACGNENTVATLLLLLASENKGISAAAFTALTQLPDCDGKTNAALRTQHIVETQLSATLRILASRQDREIFPNVIAATTATDDTHRAAAYEAIALLVRPGDLPQILPLAANIKKAPDRREWTKALYNSAAAHPDTAEAVRLLQQQLTTAKSTDRSTLIAALTMVKSDDAKAALRTMLTASDSATRKDTIRSLSSARSENAYELLTETIASATDASERMLAQRGAVDAVDQLTMTSEDKVAAYRTLWKTATTDDEKSAIIAAVKHINAGAAHKFLKEIAPE